MQQIGNYLYEHRHKYTKIRIFNKCSKLSKYTIKKLYYTLCTYFVIFQIITTIHDQYTRFPRGVTIPNTTFQTIKKNDNIV